MKSFFIFCIIFFGFCAVMNSQCDTILLKSQTDIDSFNCISPIGNLYINDDNDGLDPITSLLPLREKGLKVINGSLYIENCHQLKNLDGLDLIESIGKNFEIKNNDSLAIISSDSIGFPFHMSSIDSALIIDNNKSLLSINGFDSLDSPQLSIIISNHGKLMNVGSFEFLEEIEQFKLINNNQFNATISFPALNAINDSLVITDNDNLQNCFWIRDLIRYLDKGNYIVENNGSSCTVGGGGDIEPPGYANCPENAEINNISGQCIGIYNYTDPFVTDNVNVVSYNLTIISSYGDTIAERAAESGISFSQLGFTLGENIILYEAIDEAGNVGTCEVIVSLLDIEPPFIAEGLEDVTISTITQTCEGIYSIVFPPVIENCSIIDSRIVILNSFSMDTVYQTEAFEGVNYNIDLSPGNYMIRVIVSDETTLSDLDSAEIIVIDENEVQIVECLKDTSIIANESCLNIYSYTSPQLQGACENSMILREILSETGSLITNGLILPNTIYTDTFPAGNNELVFRYINGTNTAECSSIIKGEKFELSGVELTAENINCISYKGKIKAVLDSVEGSYQWSGPKEFTSDSLEVEVNSPGYYVFKISQENGCTSEFGINVFQDDTNVEFDLTLGEINCEEGFRQLVIDTELPDFNYKWSGPDLFEANIKSPDIAKAGWYYAEAEGDFGCYGIDSILIENDIKYDYELMIDGNTAKVIISGGTPPFIFKWDETSLDDSITGLENGAHNLRIVDGLGCSKDVPFEIMVSSLNLTEIKEITFYPNPAVEVLNLKGLADGITFILNTQGITQKMITGKTEISLDIKDWPAGIYFISTMGNKNPKTVKFLKL